MTTTTSADRRPFAGRLGEAAPARRAVVGAGALPWADADHVPGPVGGLEARGRPGRRSATSATRPPAGAPPRRCLRAAHRRAPRPLLASPRPPSGSSARPAPWSPSSGLDPARAHLGHPLAADVVAPPLQHGEVQRRRQPEARLDLGQVLLRQLVLQRLGRRGHDDLLAAERGRDEVGERLAGPRPGLHDEVGARGHRLGHGAAHLLLLGPVLAAGHLRRDLVEPLRRRRRRPAGRRLRTRPRSRRRRGRRGRRARRSTRGPRPSSEMTLQPGWFASASALVVAVSSPGGHPAGTPAPGTGIMGVGAGGRRTRRRVLWGTEKRRIHSTIATDRQPPTDVHRPPPPQRGWYPVPGNPNYQHFWDGQKWGAQRYWGGGGATDPSAPAGVLGASGRAGSDPFAASDAPPLDLDAPVQYRGFTGAPFNPRSPARQIAVAAITIVVFLVYFSLHIFPWRVLALFLVLGVLATAAGASAPPALPTRSGPEGRDQGADPVPIQSLAAVPLRADLVAISACHTVGHSDSHRHVPGDELDLGVARPFPQHLLPRVRGRHVARDG